MIVKYQFLQLKIQLQINYNFRTSIKIFFSLYFCLFFFKISRKIVIIVNLIHEFKRRSHRYIKKEEIRL
jgi:hypothetical protein